MSRDKDSRVTLVPKIKVPNGDLLRVDTSGFKIRRRLTRNSDDDDDDDDDDDGEAIVPLPSPSMSPAGSDRIFESFNGQPLPVQTKVSRASSIRRPLVSQMQIQNRSISVDRTPSFLPALNNGLSPSSANTSIGDNSISSTRPCSSPRPSMVRATSGELNIKKRERGQVFEAFDRHMNRSTWREVKALGEGAFSKVVLACPAERFVKPQYQSYCDRLVAVKIIDMSAAASQQGAAHRERLEAGLKREIDILHDLKQHPSLIRLYAFNMDSSSALLILPYCAGGDLYQLAANERDVLSIELIRRIFAETVNAVAYLHSNNIVHRDIKLENILINEPLSKLVNSTTLGTSTSPIVTLTDLGLSRKIDPEDPMLTTRCGSEDYVAPEIAMAQPYDGRQTDSWALGVVLYAMLEGKLPFDPPPKARNRRTSHRIARVEWNWANPDKFDDTVKSIVEGCISRRDVRWSLQDILQSEWLKGYLPELVLNAEEEDAWIGNMFLPSQSSS